MIRLRSVFPAAALCVVAFAVPRLSYGSSEERLNTVHFNTICGDYGTPVRRTYRYFQDANLWSAPSRYDLAENNGVVRFTDRSYAANNSTRLQDDSYDQYHDYGNEESQDAVVNGMYALANRLVQSGRWSQARLAYLSIVHKTKEWTGNLRDRVDIVNALIAESRPTTAEQHAAKLYLTALERERSGRWLLAKSLMSRLDGAEGGQFLKDRVRYQLARIADDLDNTPEALILYSHFVESYPRSSKREDALITIARICILQKAPDQKSLETGSTAIRRLRSSYPRTRFYRSALGLQGRVHFLRGQYSDALWCYYQVGDLDSSRIVCEAMPTETSAASFVRLLEAYLRRIDAADVRGEDAETVREINRLRSRLSIEMLRKFQSDLKGSPPLLVSYIYYRLYYTNTRPQDLANLADLARSTLTRNRKIVVNPAVEVRLAEVEYQQRHYPQCIEWASRALEVDHRIDRALFIRASGEAKSNRLEAAKTDLQAVLKISKDHPLRQGARELLALTCEQAGDPGMALDQYFELRYDLDIDYLLDVRMTTAQIEAYLHRCRGEKVTYVIDSDHNATSKPINVTYTRLNLLKYTLGIHYLRQERWSDAGRWLLQVPEKLRHTFDTGRRTFGSSPSPDALTAVNDLERLQQVVRNARGYEAKAEAAYRYASYYHTHGELLLYNAMLWDGDRVYAFEIIWNSRIETRADAEALKSYLSRHEVDIRSRELCLAVARQFPRSKVAPQALYRAACASHEVGALAWWYQRNNKGFRFKPAGEPEALMQRLVRQYPHSPLVPNANKYAAVFAAETRPASWPHYAVAGEPNRRRGDAPSDAAAIADAEKMLVATE